MHDVDRLQRVHERRRVQNGAHEPPPDIAAQLEREDAGEDYQPQPLADGPRVIAPPRFVPLPDIFAPLDPPEHVIADVVRRGSLVLVAGYGSSIKTWLALDACLAVACGDRWLDRFEAKRGCATFLDWESGGYELKRRTQLLAAARGVSPVEGLSLVTMSPLRMGSPDFAVAAEHLAQHADLVAIDSLRAASTGDENDSRIRIGLDQLRDIGDRRGCAFVVLVHAKKTSGAPTAVDEREVLRGSSAVFDAADTVLLSTFHKVGERFEVSQAKARHGRKVEPFTVRLSDDRGGVVVSAEDVEPPAERKSPEEAFSEAQARVLDAVRRNPDAAGVGALQELLRMRRATVSAAVDTLIARGALTNLGTKSKPRLRVVVETP